MIVGAVMLEYRRCVIHYGSISDNERQLNLWSVNRRLRADHWLGALCRALYDTEVDPLNPDGRTPSATSFHCSRADQLYIWDVTRAAVVRGDTL